MIPKQINNMAHDDAESALEILRSDYPDVALQLQAVNIEEDQSSEVAGDATYWVTMIFSCKGATTTPQFIEQDWEYVISDGGIYSCGTPTDLAADLSDKLPQVGVDSSVDFKKVCSKAASKIMSEESFEVTDETEVAESNLKEIALEDIQDLIDQSSKNYYIASVTIGDHSEGHCEVQVKLLDDSKTECDAVLDYEILDDSANLANTKEIMDFLEDRSITSSTFIVGTPIMAEEDFPSMEDPALAMGDEDMGDPALAEDNDAEGEAEELESETITQDEPAIDTDNNIENHYIAECDVCHGIFISAVVESDQVIDHISGMCPLCQKDSDQKLKWIIKPVEHDEKLPL